MITGELEASGMEAVCSKLEDPSQPHKPVSLIVCTSYIPGATIICVIHPRMIDCSSCPNGSGCPTGAIHAIFDTATSPCKVNPSLGVGTQWGRTWHLAICYIAVMTT